MAGAYSDVAALAADVAFQGKIRVALLDAAADVLAEAENTPQFDRRRELAVMVIRSPTTEVERAAWLVAASNESIRAAAPAVPSDGDVQFAVNSLWSALAVR